MAIKIGAKLYTDKLKFCFDFANPKCVYPIGSYGTEAIDLNGITTGDGYRNPVQLSNQVGYTSGSNLHFNGEYVYDFPTDTVHANPRFVHERGAPGIRFDTRTPPPDVGDAGLGFSTGVAPTYWVNNDDPLGLTVQFWICPKEAGGRSGQMIICQYHDDPGDAEVNRYSEWRTPGLNIAQSNAAGLDGSGLYNTNYDYNDWEEDDYPGGLFFGPGNSYSKWANDSGISYKGGNTTDPNSTNYNNNDAAQMYGQNNNSWQYNYMQIGGFTFNEIDESNFVRTTGINLRFNQTSWQSFTNYANMGVSNQTWKVGYWNEHPGQRTNISTNGYFTNNNATIAASGNRYFRLGDRLNSPNNNNYNNAYYNDGTMHNPNLSYNDNGYNASLKKTNNTNNYNGWNVTNSNHNNMSKTYNTENMVMQGNIDNGHNISGGTGYSGRYGESHESYDGSNAALWDMAQNITMDAQTIKKKLGINCTTRMRGNSSYQRHFVESVELKVGYTERGASAMDLGDGAGWFIGGLSGDMDDLVFGIADAQTGGQRTIKITDFHTKFHNEWVCVTAQWKPGAIMSLSVSKSDTLDSKKNDGIFDPIEDVKETTGVPGKIYATDSDGNTPKLSVGRVSSITAQGRDWHGLNAALGCILIYDSPHGYIHQDMLQHNINVHGWRYK